MAKQVYIKTILNNAACVGKKLLSVEFYSNRDADLDFYEAINPSFCSLTWSARNLSDLDGLSAIALGRKLHQRSINMIMHVAGRNFKREEALMVINKIKDMGVRNILALKGGKFHVYIFKFV